MIFSSIIFLFYFLPITLILFFVFKFSRTMQNIILLIASLVFYAWGEPKNIILLMISIIINYIFGLLVHKYRDQKKKAKVNLIICIIINLIMLFIFKYLTFVIENINLVSGKNLITMEKIALPIGISFFTFQALSYVIDVYREDAKVEKNPFYVGLYITFFPQLIAGPIVRFNSISEQIRFRKVDFNRFSAGSARFTMGLVKKILLANNFAIVADYIFGFSLTYQEVPVLLAWVGAISYTLQIFFDFSAYSDMAIGLGLVFGFKFEENFNYPYISKSVGEFWRRWHISLSTWFREYVYFPLGGSRVNNQDTMVRNLFVVWFLTGVWHGANWTFFLWGICNFIFILLERFFDFEKKNIPIIVKRIYLLFVIIIGWVLFRAEDMGHASRHFASMFGVNGAGFTNDTVWMFLKEYAIFYIAGIVLSTPIAKKITTLVANKKMKVWGGLFNMLYPIALITLFIVSVSYLVKGSYNPFIYFDF